MIAKLVAMYKKGAMTGHELVVRSLNLVAPKCPDAVLAALPPELNGELLKFVDTYEPGLMRSNYPTPLPTTGQIEAVKRWLAPTAAK